MIKLKKIVAIALAATMCMGLSMTAFAVDNGGNGTATEEVSELGKIPSPKFIPGTENTVGTTDGKGTQNDELDLNRDPMETQSKTYKSIDTVSEVASILSENGLSIPKGAQVVPIDYRNITGISEDMKNVVTFTLTPAQFTDNKYDYGKLHEGDTVYAMIETGEDTGVWEMVPGTLNKDGAVDFTVDHKGTIILVKAMKNGKVVQFTKNSNGDDVKPPVIIDPTDPTQPVQPVDPNKPGTSTNPSNGQNANGGVNAAGNAFTSPKTGEF